MMYRLMETYKSYDLLFKSSVYRKTIIIVFLGLQSKNMIISFFCLFRRLKQSVLKTLSRRNVLKQVKQQLLILLASRNQWMRVQLIKTCKVNFLSSYLLSSVHPLFCQICFNSFVIPYASG